MAAGGGAGQELKPHTIVSECLHATDDCVKQYLEPLAPVAQLEDFNAAAIVMDVDGNGWSDRMSRVVQFPTATFKQVRGGRAPSSCRRPVGRRASTPVLHPRCLAVDVCQSAQASNHTAFFEHLLAPGHAAEYFANDLSDLTVRAGVGRWEIEEERGKRTASSMTFQGHWSACPGSLLRLLPQARAHRLVAEWNASSTRLMKLAAQKQGLGLTFLNQVRCLVGRRVQLAPTLRRAHPTCPLRASALWLQVAVAEAAAYSVLQYAKKVTWPVRAPLSGGLCCRRDKELASPRLSLAWLA